MKMRNMSSENNIYSFRTSFNKTPNKGLTSVARLGSGKDRCKTQEKAYAATSVSKWKRSSDQQQILQELHTLDQQDTHDLKGAQQGPTQTHQVEWKFRSTMKWRIIPVIMEYCSFLSLIKDTHILQALELRLFGGDRKEKSSTEREAREALLKICNQTILKKRIVQMR